MSPVTPPPTRSTATRTACGPRSGRAPRRRRRTTFRSIWARCTPSAASGICRGRTGRRRAHRAIPVLRQHGWRDLGHGGRVGDVPEHGGREGGAVHGEVGTVRPVARADGSQRPAVDDGGRTERAGASGGPPPISQGELDAAAVDSQETDVAGYAATNAFDGNPNSLWATQWSSAAPPPPHDIQINLGAAYTVSGFRYLPQQTVADGTRRRLRVLRERGRRELGNAGGRGCVSRSQYGGGQGCDVRAEDGTVRAVPRADRTARPIVQRHRRAERVARRNGQQPGAHREHGFALAEHECPARDRCQSRGDGQRSRFQSAPDLPLERRTRLGNSRPDGVESGRGALRIVPEPSR